jgi:hypothetical protein
MPLSCLICTGVRRRPSQSLLLSALRTAAAQHQASKAWAVLAEVGLTLRQRAVPGLAPLSSARATQEGVAEQQHDPPCTSDGGSRVEEPEQEEEEAVPWLVVLHSEPQLPALPASSSHDPGPVPGSSEGGGFISEGPCGWVTAQQGGVHVWWDQLWGTPPGESWSLIPSSLHGYW